MKWKLHSKVINSVSAEFAYQNNTVSFMVNKYHLFIFIDNGADQAQMLEQLRLPRAIVLDRPISYAVSANKILSIAKEKVNEEEYLEIQREIFRLYF